jgi:thiamine biosynthesis protein ThiI
MYDMILVRYGEMTLKKKNYKTFLNQINNNIKEKCRKFENLKYFNTDYRFYIYLNGTDHNLVLNELNTVVGLYSYSLCRKVKEVNKENVILDIVSTAIEIIEENRPKNEFTFKVETHRGDKSFPLTSIQISQQVAKLVLPKIEGMKVDVHNPELTLNIDFRSEGIYVYTNSIKGLGGYPSGIAGKGLVMMSGGIDSPVASYLAIRKGVLLSAIHFASPPYTSDMALQKVIDLLEQLSIYQTNQNIKLHVVPFTEVQTLIHEKANPIYMVTLMRRAMYKIASKLCEKEGYQCIINGESIGQVASQTLESISVIENVASIPVIRPLAMYDKKDIIDIAVKIKSFDISIRPYEDCCTVFVPKHPQIKPKLDVSIEEENHFNYEEMIETAVNNVQVIEIDMNKHYSVFEESDIL